MLFAWTRALANTSRVSRGSRSVKNPAGSECQYFYGDYYRGRQREECRLLRAAWAPDLCRTCPIPSIVRANDCEYLRLSVTIERSLRTAFQRRVRVTPSCTKSGRSGFDPHLGCGECHDLSWLETKPGQ